MKNKIIAIIVTIVFIAGAGTAIGITVNRQHDKETASLVNEAVSKALETTATTTTEATTAATTTTTTKPAATEKATASAEAQTVTDTTHKKYEAIANKQSNHVQYANSSDDVNSGNNQQNNAVNVNDPPKHAVGEIIKDPNGDYFATNLLTHDENKFPVYVDCTSNLFYFKDNMTGSYRIYVDKSEYN